MKMNSKKQILYLLQVAVPFGLLAWLKHPFFFLPLIFILISLPFMKFRLKLIHGWQYLGEFLGKFISPIILSIIYYLGLSSLAVLRRLGGSDTLKLKRPKESTLMSVTEVNVPERFDDLW